MDDPLWPLLRDVDHRGADAWPALVAALDPVLAEMARRQPVGRRDDRDDVSREVVARVLARLHKREFEAIHKLCALHPQPELRAWLRVLVKRSAVDHMRSSPEYERGNEQRAARWISLATLSSRPAADVDTLAVKRQEVLAFVRDAVARATDELARHGADEATSRLARDWKIDRAHVRRLVARTDRYFQVLSSVLEGRSYVEVAAQLGLSKREVELTVRYVEELLAARGFAG